MEEFVNELKSIYPEIDFMNETKLFDEGLLTSLDVGKIIALVQEKYDVLIPPSKLRPTYFNSAKALWELIEELQEE